MMRRRDVLAAAVAAIPTQVVTRLQAATPSRELQHGDPDLPYESLDRSRIRERTGMRAILQPRNNNFADTLVQTAQEFVGMNRESNADQIAQFLRLFGLRFKEGDHLVPFCAAGLSYVTALSYARFWKQDLSSPVTTLQQAFVEVGVYHFYPSPSVIDIMRDAQARHRWLAVAHNVRPVPKKGWLAIYNFGHPADHVGLVTAATDKTLETIEFNTSDKTHASTRDGGAIRARTRTYDHTVLGFVKTDHSGSW